MLGYNCSTRNRKFKRLEPHFQRSATRSTSNEGTETAVALPHPRECTKDPISALPNNGSMGKFGARAELRNILQGKIRGRGALHPPRFPRLTPRTPRAPRVGGFLRAPHQPTATPLPLRFLRLQRDFRWDGVVPRCSRRGHRGGGVAVC